MLNAAKVISARDEVGGLLSTNALMPMRDELSVTHIFVIDKTGKFLRSTNEDPNLIPNVNNFCPTYKGMASRSEIEATPIIHPNPEPKPYKFLFLPTKNHQRIVEVGVRVDFVAKILTEALGSDSNIKSLALYSPNGTLFGRFDSTTVNFKSATVKLPAEFPTMVETKDAFHFFTKVISSHPKCCQCDISKTSKDGEYYYVLESEVSKQELSVILASTKNIFLLLGFANLFISILLARFLARRLVRNIEAAVLKVRTLKTDGNLKNRLGCKGKDEVAFLTQEFDRLLDTLESAQEKIVESEKIQAKVQLAKEVAHNIRSPVLAIEMMLPSLTHLPIRLQKVFIDSAREVRALSDRLSRQADGLNENSLPKSSPVNIVDELKHIVNKKIFEYSNKEHFRINLQIEKQSEDCALLNITELSAVISNLINNSLESYINENGFVLVKYDSNEIECEISIVDGGRGIPEEIINQLGNAAISSGKEFGRGIGLQHAMRTLNAWGGSLKVHSSCESGTHITLVIPKIKVEFDRAEIGKDISV